jgi:hypothetical protein
VLIEGRLQLDPWDDKQTGQKRMRLAQLPRFAFFLGPFATVFSG